MKQGRLIALLGLGLIALLGCSNDSADTEAAVVLTANITAGPAEVDVSVPEDVTIPNMSISSSAKAPGTQLGSQQDVILTEWVVTATRTDGGTVASPQWRNYYSVLVTAGGSANVQNYRIFPAEYFQQPPLNQLFPQNGGFDRETGQRVIRQRLSVQVYGKTVSGQRVVLDMPDVNLRFYYQTP